MIDPQDAPLLGFFDLNIGGLSEIYHPPETPIAFEYTVEGMPSFRMTLFDLTGKDVEPKLFSDQQQADLTYKGTFDFGWINPDNKYSKTEFRIDHYEKDILDTYSFNITIFGMNLISPLASCNQIHGTAKESLQKFADMHGYDLEITPGLGTDYMRYCGKQSRDTTELQEMKFIKNQNETDFDFVHRVTTYCRDGNGQVGYMPVFGDGSKTGKRKLSIIIPQKTIAATYKVQGRDTQVVRWKPSISVASSVLGAHDIHWNTIQPISGDNCKINLNQNLLQQEGFIDNDLPVKPLLRSLPMKDDPTRLVQVGGAENFEAASTNGAVRNEQRAAHHPTVDSILH